MTIFPLTVTLAAAATMLVPHVFPDGHVERTVAVVVRDRTLHIEYSVGMNDVTMQRMIEAWKNPLPPANGTLDGTFKSIEAGSADVAIQDSIQDSNQKIAPEPTPEPFDFDLTKNLNEEDFQNDETIVAEFKRLAVEHFSQQLCVKLDETELELEAVEQPVPTRLHMSLTMEFVVKIPRGESAAEGDSAAGPSATGPVRFEFVDRNFLSSTKSTPWHGAIRTSLKALGGAMLVNSPAAPILIRAERVELTGATAEKRKQAATISGTLILPND